VTAFLSIRSISRRLKDNQRIESLKFVDGVNVVLGKPNTGKTKWMQTLDFLLGEAGEKNPLTPADDERLKDKYDAASAELNVGEERLTIERRWLEPGAIGKVFVNGQPMVVREFQHYLLEKLGIPLVHYPKGNPASGQTWPELSFRSLLRHIYRRQKLWTDIADQQPDDEQHACLMQFLGLAERVFTPQYGQLVRLKVDVDRLKARREQHGTVLSSLTNELVADPGMTVGITGQALDAAVKRLSTEAESLSTRRKSLIAGALNKAIPAGQRSMIERTSERRSELLQGLEMHLGNEKRIGERLAEMKSYRHELGNELERMLRAEDAGSVLADLKITHCPACDQSVDQVTRKDGRCFLCDQSLPDEPVEELGALRLKYERDRLQAEIKEADELLGVLQKDATKIANEISRIKEELHRVESQLAPARSSVAALVQEQVSEVDMALGRVAERERQLGRVKGALAVGDDLSRQIEAKEKEIEPLEATVGEAARATDYERTATLLAAGMNTYLSAINELRPKVWPHSEVFLDVSRSTFRFKVGTRSWYAALGGTDSLYFLMAYHYGLLTLSAKPGCHYPGIVLIDMPADFVGEAVADKENFIVQPFIDLLKKPEYTKAQVVITGAAFDGLGGVNRLPLTRIYVAS
jgi:hypothetical protein